MSDPKRAVEGRRVLWRRPEFWLLAVGAALSLAKLYLLEVNSREILECRWCLAGKGVPHELGFILTIAALYAPSALPRWRPLRWALRALVLALLLITLADLVVIRLFVMRLSWDELVKFIPETEAIEAFVRQLIAGPWRSALALVGSAALLGAAAWFLACEPQRRRPLPGIAAPALAAFLLGQWLPKDYHSEYLNNSLEAFVNFPTRERAYSPAFASTIAATPRVGPARLGARA